jgi:hypothetical protein
LERDQAYILFADAQAVLERCKDDSIGAGQWTALVAMAFVYVVTGMFLPFVFLLLYFPFWC